MDATDLKNWRKRLGLNQVEAAKRLGVGRASIQYWEQDLWPIPHVTELACQQIMRRWKQRPEFGPVLLIYIDDPIWQHSERPYHVSILHSAVYPNNETAMLHVDRHKNDPYFINPVLMETNGDIIWTTSELLEECRSASKSRHGRASGSTRRSSRS
jgi:DNA-binding XRE family transcriptional regulator